MQSLKLKNFTKKIEANLVFAKEAVSIPQSLSIPPFSLSPSSQKVKIFLYRFLKILKKSKGKSLGNLPRLEEKVGSKFQVNGFYNSVTEEGKKKKVRILKRNLLLSLRENPGKASLHQRVDRSRSLPQSRKGRKKRLKSLVSKKKRGKVLRNGVETFESFYGDWSKRGEERRSFLRMLIKKRFFPRIFFSRLFLYSAKGQKRYKNLFTYLLKRRRKIDSLFHLYTLSSLKFKDAKKKSKKVFKKLAWTSRKKKKRMRMRLLFSFSPRRHKLSQIFYVPKQFEINYKTLGTNYLGYTDLKTTNRKIGFWLNLRKVLTFLS